MKNLKHFLQESYLMPRQFARSSFCLEVAVDFSFGNLVSFLRNLDPFPQFWWWVLREWIVVVQWFSISLNRLKNGGWNALCKLGHFDCLSNFPNDRMQAVSTWTPERITIADDVDFDVLMMMMMMMMAG
ncbi:hypothetical protein T02_13656 [Trichinella nativa]|uniref:Uncharacterized protein n=1 Tax=Trichinella nativa TaxID=6335 RepID=A0A0V1LHN7_9BILA|nr:hypothetical protein T02_13656 [Trichinella nativa]